MTHDPRLPITAPAPAEAGPDLEFPWFGYDPDCDCPRCEYHREHVRRRIAADVLENTRLDPEEEDEELNQESAT